MRQITRTSKSKIRQLTVEGKKVLDLYQQLLVMIKTINDPSCTNLLSEPSFNTAKDEIIWYSNLEGEMIRVSDCSPDEQMLYLDQLEEIANTIKTFAEEAKNSGDRQAEYYARLVVLALTYADDDSVYVIDEQPVLVNWGCEFVQGRQQKRTLGGRAQRAKSTTHTHAIPPHTVVNSSNEETNSIQDEAEVPPITDIPVDTNPEKKSTNWRRIFSLVCWVLSLLVLLLLLLFLLRGCEPELAAEYIDDESLELRDQSRQEHVFRNEIIQLKKQLLVKRQDCANGALCAQPELEQSEIQRRVEKELGKTDDSNLSIALAWNSLHDLDLLVGTPDGKIISFRSKQGQGGGRLNIDYNEKINLRVKQPVEHISWPGNAPKGKYKVSVMLYNVDRRETHINPIPFSVVINQQGETKTFNGRFPLNEAAVVTPKHEILKANLKMIDEFEVK